MSRHIPRIYYDNRENITDNKELILPNRWNNHLINVFRIKIYNEIIIYNEEYGEWLCSITSINKNKVLVKCNKLLRYYKSNINASLAFCLIKYDNIKLIIEKCTELGITDFYPLISSYTQFNKINIDKLNLIAIQASEQSERLDVPTIHNICNINDFINNLPRNIKWYSAIERTSSDNIIINNNVGFIVGPEGGFSEKEKQLLNSKTMQISISKNVLRAETACISCASLFAYLSQLD